MTGRARPSPNLKAIGNLFTAPAIALIGATPDLTKLGSSPMLAMRQMGYKGEIFAVNPRYQTVMEHPCVASVADLPNQVQAAMINVPAEIALRSLEECAVKGIRSIVLVPQGFGEAGEEGKERDRKVVELAARYDLAVCGPNTNGIANVGTGLAMSITPIFQFPDGVRPGTVSVVSQSGGMISTILRKMGPRGIGIAKTVTCGNELLLTVADYLSYLAEDPETHAIVLFLETIRDAPALQAALAKCRAAGKPLIALKVGQSSSGQKAALCHTGAIAGSYQNTVAFLEHEGVIVAPNLETLVALSDLLMRYDWPLAAPLKPCIISISGGFAAMAADEMTALGLELPDLSPQAVKEIEALPTQSHAVNPFDIASRNAVIPDAIDIFRRDGFNVLIFGLALLKDDIRVSVRETVFEARHTFTHLIVASPALPEGENQLFFKNGISVYDDTRPLFAALATLSAHAKRTTSAKAPLATKQAMVKLPAAPGLLNEADSKAIVAGLGIEVPRSQIITNEAQLRDLGGLRRPVVMKGLSEHIAHKTEHGLVALGLSTDEEIATAYRRIASALAKADPDAKSILVEEMSSGGLEAIVGIVRDPVLGPMVVVGAGGILVELLDDAIVIKPPFSEAELDTRLSRTKFGKLLSGYRGRSYDRGALLRAAVAIGDFALREPRVESLDVNPLFVRDHGVMALDAKMTLSGEV